MTVENPHEEITKFTAISGGLIDFRQSNRDIKSPERGLWMLRLPEGHCCRVEIRAHFARHFVASVSIEWCWVSSIINAGAAANFPLLYVVDRGWSSLVRVERIKRAGLLPGNPWRSTLASYFRFLQLLRASQCAYHIIFLLAIGLFSRPLAY
jgi:hypothetical protein